jgi:hypothetical protein
VLDVRSKSDFEQWLRTQAVPPPQTTAPPATTASATTGSAATALGTARAGLN